MDKSLKGKRILITAGPTWAPIDDVRIIGNVSSGELGMLLAKNALDSGAYIDLFLGPVNRPVLLDKKIKLIRFTFFNELRALLVKALKSKRYDIILHCAAVSDYLPKLVKGKISSDADQLELHMVRAPKIIDQIRQISPGSFLVMFKLESGVTDAVLLKRALEAMKRAGADLVVANRFIGKKYRGFILGSGDVVAKTVSKQKLASKLFQILQEKFKR